MNTVEIEERHVGLLTVTSTPELKPLPNELEASDTKMYEPLGTVVVFQAHNHPYRVGVALQRTGASKP